MVGTNELNTQGANLYVRGDVEGARLHYLAALKTDPNNSLALANMATLLGNQHKLASAEALFRRLVTELPSDPNRLFSLGNVLCRSGKFAEAEDILKRAASIAPDNPACWHNLSLMSYWVGDLTSAKLYAQKVFDLGHDTKNIKNDYAHILLAQGEELVSALDAYEIRWWHMAHLLPWDFHIPEWKGEDLSDKTILFHGEQGFGDTIMCARFVNDLVRRGARVILGLPGVLCRLFNAQKYSGVTILNIDEMEEDDVEGVDFQSPMYSAMRWLGLNHGGISSVPYISAPKLDVPDVNPDFYNIGICWASGKRNADIDWRRRVSALSDWLQLMDIPGTHFYSLFRGDEESEIDQTGLRDTILFDPMPKIRDFADTSAFIDKLDLVISVDTALVHLAGAMGKRIWMLAQYTPCWRWWDLKGKSISNGQPWYDQMRIFRQHQLHDWSSQLKTVRQDLEFYVNDKQMRRAA